MKEKRVSLRLFMSVALRFLDGCNFISLSHIWRIWIWFYAATIRLYWIIFIDATFHTGHMYRLQAKRAFYKRTAFTEHHRKMRFADIDIFLFISSANFMPSWTTVLARLKMLFRRNIFAALFCNFSRCIPLSVFILWLMVIKGALIGFILARGRAHFSPLRDKLLFRSQSFAFMMMRFQEEVVFITLHSLTSPGRWPHDVDDIEGSRTAASILRKMIGFHITI